MYNPGRFISTYENENGQAIWDFLNLPENIIRMETASYLKKPAVTPLSVGLLNEFGETIKVDRMKQMIGHMVRQIMENKGYRLDQSHVKITIKNNIFGSGSKYKMFE